MTDEGGDQSLAPTLSAVGFGDVEGVKQHCFLTVRMNEFVAVDPAGNVIAVFDDQECRLRPPEEGCRVDVALNAELATRAFGKQLIAVQ